jgi:Ca2+-binding RTX toxin-like protein
MTGTGRSDDIRLYPADPGGQQFVADLTGAIFLVKAIDAARANISAGGGDDIVRALTGATGGPLTVSMNVSGGAGNDTMTGGAGNDVLLGDDGNDALDGGRGADAVLGGAGDDLILAAENLSPGTGLGDDFYAGGAGTDMISYAGRTARLNLRLGSFATGAPGERDTVRGDIERAVGGAGDDRIEGTNDNNILFGGDGDDTLVGRGGNDVLLGEAGDDVLTDYSGTNTLEGGEGNDTVNGVRETVPTVTLEAETATIVGSAVVSRSNGGYTGTGYVDFNAARGDAVEWTYDSPSAGQRTLTFRYANGGTTDRPLELKVNDAIINPRLSFAPTGGWTTWRTVTVTVQLAAGVNRIRLTSIGSNGGNIDSLTIS